MYVEKENILVDYVLNKELCIYYSIYYRGE